MNTYKPMFKNPIKLIQHKNEKPDKYFEEKQKNIYNLFSKLQNNDSNDFNNWMNSPLHKKNPYITSNQVKYKRSLIFNNNEIVTKKMYIEHFISLIEKKLTDNNYTINNNKQFRDTIASFVYRNSAINNGY